MCKAHVIVINPDDDYQLMMNSSLRYALGRHTYMVKATADYSLSILCVLSDKTLHVMESDLKYYFDHTVPLGSEFTCDIKTWESLRCAIQRELETRKGGRMKYAIMEIDGNYYPARLENGKYKLFKYGPFNIFTVKFEFYFDAREFIEGIHDSYKKWVIEEIKL